MNNTDLKLIVTLSGIEVGQGVLTLGSALLISQKLQQYDIEEFVDWLSKNADKLSKRILYEHKLSGEELDEAVAEVAKRLLELEIKEDDQ